MAEVKASQERGQGETGVKMEPSEAPTSKDHGFGEIVTLNVGGKRWVWRLLVRQQVLALCPERFLHDPQLYLCCTVLSCIKHTHQCFVMARSLNRNASCVDEIFFTDMQPCFQVFYLKTNTILGPRLILLKVSSWF